ncbi:macro domain-containing protein [Vibrio parahaemolyticus]|uniref:macro domain-containing protein n=1 Tax=Vibrio parahaemolyticus TaxID=670 RepID=UPI001FAD5578|nr:macro domain-containing protein [Vibrio parahaemolyticus]MCI9724477.1 hypothetical protein [Vibrio parahaemolyticus]HCE2384107.1 hypothetical protein [Vibrio parahaemolyticus]
MSKVSFIDKRVRSEFLKIISVLSTVISLIVLFVDIPKEDKVAYGFCFIGVLFIIYVLKWYTSNNLNEIEVNIEESSVVIKVGDIFLQDGWKVIAFNEYFDTLVDNKVIASSSLNGIFINKCFSNDVAALDQHIEQYDFDDAFLDDNLSRKSGKSKRYKLGTICVYNDFIMTAFTKFDKDNKAVITMPEYLEFLINFWDKVNIIYAQQSVSTPIFGSGITRINGHRSITDEDLLKIMLWTFRISEMRFKKPAKLNIIIHESKIDRINLLDIKSSNNGL